MTKNVSKCETSVNLLIKMKDKSRKIKALDGQESLCFQRSLVIASGPCYHKFLEIELAPHKLVLTQVLQQ